MAAQFATVEGYIGSFPGDVQDILRAVRGASHDPVPEAGERISYGIAAFTLGPRTMDGMPGSGGGGCCARGA
jgi:uncharacterized protein YdhG (YjbR/CyaY superfamily)